MEGINLIYYLSCIIWYFIFLIMIIYLNYRHNIEHSRTFNDKVYETVPSYLNPGELNLLLYRRIRPDAITATILILIKKEVFTLKKIQDNYHLVLNNRSDIKLSTSQRYLVDLLIKTFGDGEQISFKEIDNICNSGSGCTSFLMNYQIWLKMMYKESSKKRFYEEKTGYAAVKAIRLFGILIFLTNIIGGYFMLLGYFIIIPAFFLPMFFYKIYKRTKPANEEYYKWLAFKNYLGQIEKYKYDKNEIDTYLIYSVILNIKGLENKIAKYDYIDNLNNIINRCVIKANLHGKRALFKNEL